MKLIFRIILFAISFQVSAAISVEGRVKYQNIQNVNFNIPNSSRLFSRLLLRSHFDFSEDYSFRWEVISAVDSQYANEAYSLEHNELDLHQGYFTYLDDKKALFVGRQVWEVGEQRLLGKREGTNVRRRFDGFMYKYSFSNIQQINIYSGFAVDSKAGIFDDSSSTTHGIAGFYINSSVGLVHAMYYRDNTNTHNEKRITVEGEFRKKVFDFENFIHIALQTGDENGKKVNAWFAQYSGKYSFGLFELGPTLSYASGGNDKNGGHSFRPLFAKAPYYSEAGLFSTTNIMHIGARAKVNINSDVYVTLDIKQLYQVNKGENIYGPGRSVVISSEDIKGSNFATTYSLSGECILSKNTSIELISSYVHLNAPNDLVYLEQKELFFFESMYHYKF